MRTRIPEVSGTPVAETSLRRTLSDAQVAAIGAAAGTAFRAALKETRTPAPAPRTPGDSTDRGSGDSYRDRAHQLLGNYAFGPARSYSLSDLAADEHGLDNLTCGSRYIR